MTQQPPANSPKPKTGSLHFAINTQNPVAWYNRGGSLYQLGRYQEAIECFDRAIAIQPAYFDAWNNRGVAFKALNRHREAIECFDQAISLQPNYYQAWNNRGNAFLELANYAEAIASYDQAISLQPADELVRKNRAEALEKLTQQSQLSQIEPTESLNKNTPLSWQEECRQGWKLFQQKQETAALEHWQKLLQILPTDLPDYQQACGELYEAKAWVESKIGQLEIAQKSLLSALAFIPASDNFPHHLQLLERLIYLSHALGETKGYEHLQPLLTPHRDAIYWQVKVREVCPIILRYQQRPLTLPTGIYRQFWEWIDHRFRLKYTNSPQPFSFWLSQWCEIKTEFSNDSDSHLAMLAELSQILRVNECLSRLGNGYELILMGNWLGEPVPVERLFPQRWRIYTGAQRTGMPVPA